MRLFALLAAGLLAPCALANAGTLYFNGFEPGQPGTADFYDSTTNAQGADITIVPSNGGTLHLIAPGGANYAEITNVHNTYQNGYGESVYTDYGAQRTGTPIVINGPFYESTDYYINVSWAAASASGNYAGFWIDTTPNIDTAYLDETNFRIIDTGNGQIGVQMVGLHGSGNATITQSGWYTFKTTFENDGHGFVMNTMSVIDSMGNVVGSATVDSMLPFTSLVGTNYGDWTTVWQNGFANDTLGIDNVTVATLPPLPATKSLWGSLGLGLVLMAMRARRRRFLA